MMIIDMQRLCVILLALWTLSSCVRGQSYDTGTTAEEVTTEGTTDFEYDTATTEDPTTKSPDPVQTNPPGPPATNPPDPPGSSDISEFNHYY